MNSINKYENELKDLSKSRKLAAKVIFQAMNILKEAGDEMRGKEVVRKVGESLEFNDWEKGRYEKTNNIRWQSILHFFTIDLVKAGFLRKKSGTWILTEDGEKNLKDGPKRILEIATMEYRKWKAEQTKSEHDEAEIVDEDQLQQASIDEVEGEAMEGLIGRIKKMNAYDFQDLVAALLRGMGYYTPYIADKGPDGGIDIVAYQDPLGVKAPRIKVQVKHHPDSTIPPKDINSLTGLLHKEGDIGLFVTSGRFSKQTEQKARDSHIHIKLIDINELISMWKQFYTKLSDEDKKILPLRSVYFLGSNE